VRIVHACSGHVFYRQTHNPGSMGVATGSALVSTRFDAPADIELGPGKLYAVANGHSIGATKDQRPRERANTAIPMENSNRAGDPRFRGRPTIIPSNVRPPAVIALWSFASPILPPQHAPQNESHRQYSPSISSRSRSLPNGCARAARESPCLRWS
jgi:hypothetical protein